MASKLREYGVAMVRGPVVEVEPHPLHVDDLDDLLHLLHRFDRPRAADLFCGAGGIGAGLQAAGFDVVVGVDHDPVALATHAGQFGGLSIQCDLGDPAAIERVIDALRAIDVTIVAGGPPCQPFSRAGQSKIRSLVEAGTRAAHDHRRDLWESFLEIVLAVEPPAVLLENVPEMALGGRMEIVRTMVHALESREYTVHTRLVHAVEQGVPQHRQRFLMVAVKGGVEFEWPGPVAPVSVRDAIGDLPPVDGGARPDGGGNGWWDYQLPSDVGWFLARSREEMRGDDFGRIHDHITRPVREDDLRAFEKMTSSTKYSDLPDDLKRYRDDIFDDKYKRLDWDEPSRSITAHIARDGYWYIHPEQHRTLTVREAARIQTFPDHVRFAGPPSAQFRQIGNAVPPLLAEQVGVQVLKAMESGAARNGFSTTEVSYALERWFQDSDPLTIPWYDPETSWVAVQCEVVLRRAAPRVIKDLWPVFQTLTTPSDTLAAADELVRLGAELGRSSRVEVVLAAAAWLSGQGWDPAAAETEDVLRSAPGISRALVEVAVGVARRHTPGPVPVTTGAARVAARVFGEPVDQLRRGTAGRLAISRLVGGSVWEGEADDSRQAVAGLLELAASVCRPEPRCPDCPLRPWCRFGANSERTQLRLGDQ